MKTELFKKVYIRSEADLPKEGLYQTHDKSYGDTQILTLLAKTMGNNLFWLSNVDWYLQPVEQECVHPYSSVLGDGEMQPAKCLACGKILSGDAPQEPQPLQDNSDKRHDSTPCFGKERKIKKGSTWEDWYGDVV